MICGGKIERECRESDAVSFLQISDSLIGYASIILLVCIFGG